MGSWARGWGSCLCRPRSPDKDSLVVVVAALLCWTAWVQDAPRGLLVCLHGCGRAQHNTRSRYGWTVRAWIHVQSGGCPMTQPALAHFGWSPERLPHRAPSLLGLAHVQSAEPAPGHPHEDLPCVSGARLLLCIVG